MDVASGQVNLACSTCIEVDLDEYNLFVLEDYNLGTDVEGKIAAGGNITMNNFSGGHRAPHRTGGRSGGLQDADGTGAISYWLTFP